ncbi:enoyl-CoA hydratase-related protein [Chitinibacter tainanensis]|uniref:enoyl-CoA hydratase-related protein n=1 Tax=Chitinibacter tainanensis TaxID=230667 RepID=UPI00048E94B8|nr:enoyl-CoA hydratase-related protein [Chitinibacter tainanensis]
MSDTIDCAMDEFGVIRLQLKRPEVCHAINEIMVAELSATLTALGQNERARVLILSGGPQHFCAGTDEHWIAQGCSASADHNFEDALNIARLLRILDRLPFPTIALVDGPAIGLGCGLIACCDLIVATARSRFAVPDARLGLIPAVYGPYLINKIGSSAARRFFLTGEQFDGKAAQRIGLIHEVHPDHATAHQQVEQWCAHILRNSPHALTACKRLITSVEHRPIDDAMISDTAHRMAHIRSHEEAVEGIRAYLQASTPAWAIKNPA